MPRSCQYRASRVEAIYTAAYHPTAYNAGSTSTAVGGPCSIELVDVCDAVGANCGAQGLGMQQNIGGSNEQELYQLSLCCRVCSMRYCRVCAMRYCRVCAMGCCRVCTMRYCRVCIMCYCRVSNDDCRLHIQRCGQVSSVPSEFASPQSAFFAGVSGFPFFSSPFFINSWGRSSRMRGRWWSRFSGGC